MNTVKILIVEDSDSDKLILQTLLNEFQIYWSKSVNEVRQLLIKEEFHLVILDAYLGRESGFEICSLIRQNTRFQLTPIIMLTSASETKDKVFGLALGADDYVTKPFEPIEFKARVQAALRRVNATLAFQTISTLGELEIDHDRQIVKIKSNDSEETVDLSSIEYKLLTYLLKNKDCILSREQILQGVWGDKLNVLDRSVDSKISAIRRKLGIASNYIKSVHGVGYKVEIPQVSKLRQ